MSIDATNWAWGIQGVSSTEKLILLAYADRAGETHEAWPSWRRLILDTCLDRKTIDKGLKSLQAKGLMIKTGERVRQVYKYRLMGVKGRESQLPPKKLSPTSTKNGTSDKNGTSTKNGTGTSPKNGTRNHQLNHHRNPNAETPSFSSLSDFKTFVIDLVTATGKNPIDVLVEEVIYYADKFQETRDPVESVKMAITLIKSGKWKTPHGFKGFSSKAVREKDEQYEKQKQHQIQQDAKIGRALNEAVKTGNRQSLAEMLKEYNNANQGTVST